MRGIAGRPPAGRAEQPEQVEVRTDGDVLRLVGRNYQDKVAPRLAATEDVRAALLLVERGEAPVGIVYGTDAAVSKAVMVAGTFPASSHDPVSYPFAVVKSGDTPEARALLTFLEGPEARLVFVQRGFKVE